jgi:hypothetical protein
VTAITSTIDPGSALFPANRAAYDALLAVLTERQRWAIDGGEGRAPNSVWCSASVVVVVGRVQRRLQLVGPDGEDRLRSVA